MLLLLLLFYTLKTAVSRIRCPRPAEGGIRAHGLGGGIQSTKTLA
jgi:hypothetical protein